ncbi:hypothetical protein HCN44_011440 [Aphidius gifuensis]|uniref:PPIase cyclophilin-type domain-containing protein n=1 Tax=Aphidius gifuensis TaxID=684658 RepID=A0A834Y0B9_APHGI|nr:hypothetical protein HCN44_011440 [Aphidius gifuensis]
MNVETKIDCQPPKISLDTYYDPGKLERNARRVLEIDKENMELLKRLYIISLSRGRFGRVTSDNKDNVQPDVNKNSEYEKIRKENMEIYKSLEKVVPKVVSFFPDKKNKKRNKIIGLRPRCFFEIYNTNRQQNLGAIEIELYTDIVPNICEKFKSLCAVFYKIIYGYLCQFKCDLSVDKIDNKSLNEEMIENNKLLQKHSGPGILSFCKNDSKIFIFNLTFKKLEILDEKNIVFGKVVRAISNIYKIEAVGTKVGKPREKIIIKNCGIR